MREFTVPTCDRKQRAIDELVRKLRTGEIYLPVRQVFELLNESRLYGGTCAPVARDPGKRLRL